MHIQFSDLIDVVKDQLYGSDYLPEEDPKLYVSSKTNRGPLHDDWISEHKSKKLPPGKAIMCAYKLCKVEFRYWGMQTKIEKFIHDVGKFVPVLSFSKRSALARILRPSPNPAHVKIIGLVHKKINKI